MGTTLRASPRGPQRYPFARHGREFTYKRLRFRAAARPQWPNRKSESTSDLPLLNVEPLRKLSIAGGYRKLGPSDPLACVDADRFGDDAGNRRRRGLGGY